MDRAELRIEAILFARYLIDADPSEELIARYCQANEILFVDRLSNRDLAILEFARKHPWSIPLLDAGAAVSIVPSQLRTKLLVMMAILETTPEFAPRTEPRFLPLGRIVVRLLAVGLVTAVRVIAGAALSSAIARRRHAD